MTDHDDQDDDADEFNPRKAGTHTLDEALEERFELARRHGLRIRGLGNVVADVAIDEHLPTAPVEELVEEGRALLEHAEEIESIFEELERRADGPADFSDVQEARAILRKWTGEQGPAPAAGVS